MQFELPQWYDLHTHLRQDELLSITVADHLSAQCLGVLAMPNTQPPVAKVLQQDDSFGLSIEEYLAQISAVGGDQFTDIIVPLYLSKHTTPEMIAAGAASGLLRACKYYPPHGTTNADHGCPIDQLIANGVIAEMMAHDIVLCIHGEQHGLTAEHYFDQASNAETQFYRDTMPRLRDEFPQLRIVCEHLTTQAAVEFVQQSDINIAATITPQHLLYTVGTLLQGLKYHLYCLPLLKFTEDRQALREAVIDPNNQQFFAGTDSAPHTRKMTACGCAAGCYTAPIGPQLYAQAFEASGLDLSIVEHQQRFKRFLCELGPRFYRLPLPTKTFTLRRSAQQLQARQLDGAVLKTLPLGLGEETVALSICP